MAVKTRPFGLRPTQYLNGAPFNGQANMYFCSASDATTIYVGDLVRLDLTNGASGANDQFVGVPAITKYAAGDTHCRGVVVGFLPEPYFSMSATASLGLKYRVASTERWALVVDDPMVLHAVEEINTGTALAATDIGLNIDLSVVAGDANIGISKSVLNNATEAVTATLPLKLVRLLQVEGNSYNTATLANAPVWEVKLNTSDLMNTTGI